MTKQNIENLFELLAIFRPGDKRLKDRTLQNAWLFILEPYSPEDVREAVASYFRESSYWPDVTDIAKRCPKIPEKNQGIHSMPVGRDTKQLEEQKKLLAKYADVKRLRHEAGLPENRWEAKEQGMCFEEYDKLTEEAGLGLELIL